MVYICTVVQHWGNKLKDRLMFFDIDKLIGFAAYVMNSMNVKSMQYIMLIKLMYLSDRKFIELYDRTISNDDMVSMDHGPVLSRLLNLIHGECLDSLQKSWNLCFSTTRYNIAFTDNGEKASKNVENLSKAEMKVIDEIVAKFGSWNVWTLIDDYLHKLPEWENPHGSSIPIKFESLMKCFNKSDEEIQAVQEENKLYEEEITVCRGNNT